MYFRIVVTKLINFQYVDFVLAEKFADSSWKAGKTALQLTSSNH